MIKSSNWARAHRGNEDKPNWYKNDHERPCDDGMCLDCIYGKLSAGCSDKTVECDYFVLTEKLKETPSVYEKDGKLLCKYFVKGEKVTKKVSMRFGKGRNGKVQG